jgi:hypothetical protein
VRYESTCVCGSVHLLGACTLIHFLRCRFLPDLSMTYEAGFVLQFNRLLFRQGLRLLIFTMSETLPTSSQLGKPQLNLTLVCMF